MLLSFSGTNLDNRPSQSLNDFIILSNFYFRSFRFAVSNLLCQICCVKFAVSDLLCQICCVRFAVSNIYCPKNFVSSLRSPDSDFLRIFLVDNIITIYYNFGDLAGSPLSRSYLIVDPHNIYYYYYYFNYFQASFCYAVSLQGGE